MPNREKKNVGTFIKMWIFVCGADKAQKAHIL